MCTCFSFICIFPSEKEPQRCDATLVVFCLLFYFICVVSTVYASCATVAVLVTILVLLL